MSLSSRFLNLSMKEQICITIILLTLFCILVILIVCCSLIYEILEKDYENKKNFFYNKYKKYMESVFYFQSFHMMQYEEILHRIQKQIWKTHDAYEIYSKLKPLQNYSDYIINLTNRELYDFNALDANNSKENPFFYVISLSNDTKIQEYIHNFALYHYETFAHSIFSTNIFDSFRIPGYGVPIMDEPLFFNFNYSALFGFNRTKIDDDLKIFNVSPQLYYGIKMYIIGEFLGSANWLLEYIGKKQELFSQIYPKFIKEITIHPDDIFFNEKVRLNFSKTFVGYLSRINYDEEYFSLVTSNQSFNYFYVQMKTIPNLLFFLNHDFSSNLDIDFIPYLYQNNTLLSKDLCALFKFKQNFLFGQNFDLNEIYSNIHDKGIGLEDCFIDKDLINSQEEIKDVFDVYFDNFSEINNTIYQGVFNAIPEHSEFPFYFMKYSYPNYNTLKEFQSEYLFSNQVNMYGFASFKKAKKYVEHINQVKLNIFFFVIIIIVYSWIICLFINIIIFYKVIDDWTEPITKLQEAVESSSIKDESIFNYKYDDIINELFLTCKELLSGQINSSNDNELNHFNIFEKDNEKKIDKNLYKKNLIINNEIMEELINAQQSEMDFSNNVKLNEPNNIDSNNMIKDKQKERKKDSSKENLINNSDSNKMSQKDKNNNGNEKNKENESYIKLFKISEYLDYYRSKLENNNVIYLNEGFDETKASKFVSKNNSKTINSSLSNQKKNRNDEQNENNYINMMDEKNITYLWYMEAKKKTHCFNYNISNDCKELFMEYYDNNNSLIDQRRSAILHQKEKNTGM